MRKTPFLLVFLFACLLSPAAGAVDNAPFAIRNQSPLLQIFGLPAAGDARLPAAGTTEALLTIDVASHFIDDRADEERLLLDGETYRYSLLLRRAIGEKLTVGVEIPWLMHRDGFLDGFIEDFHDTFGLPQGGRDEAPRNRLLYLYSDNDGDEPLNPGNGLGDLRLVGAWQLYAEDDAALALHASLKLPTGDSDELLGSGSTDLALWLAGDHAYGAAVTLFAGLGALFLTDGDILADRQRNVAAFANLGVGWRPWLPVILKAQLDGHTALYDSDLIHLEESLQITVGGTVDWGNTSLDIGISEDIIVYSAPDVVFHLALRHRR